MTTTIQQINSSILPSNNRAQQLSQRLQVKQPSRKAQQHSKKLIQLEKYLFQKYDQKIKKVAEYFHELLAHHSRDQSGKKCLVLCLKYKIYESIGLINKSSEYKRWKISQFFLDFDFKKESLKDLIIGCLELAQEEGLSYQDIISIQKEVMRQMTEENINFIFHQKQLQNSYAFMKNIFSNMMADYNYFLEDSIERHIQRQLIIAFSKMNAEYIGQYINQKAPQFKESKNDIPNLVQKLKSQSNIFYEDFSNIFKLMQEDPSKIYDYLMVLKNKIMPVDMRQIERIMESNACSQQTIRNKDNIVFLGNTKCGKTASILNFLGYNLKESVYCNSTALIPAEKMNSAHESFLTAPITLCTKSINAVKLPDEIYKKGVLQRQKSLTICDTPGFGDTCGIESQIGFSATINSILSAAYSTRIVIVISHEDLKIANRQKLIELGHIISNFFYDLSTVKKIRVIFNMIPKRQIKSIPQILQKIIHNLSSSDMANKKLILVMKAIYEQSKDECNFLYPLQKNENKLFHLISPDPIWSFQQNFKFDLSSEAKEKIYRFIKLSQLRIPMLLQSKKYVEAELHFHNLQKLKKTLPNNCSIKQGYLTVCSKIKVYSENTITKIENLILQFQKIQEFQEPAQMSQYLDELIAIIVNLQKYFKKFQGLELFTEDEMYRNIIDSSCKRIQKKIQEKENYGKHLKKIIQIYSQYFDPSLKSKIIKILEKKIIQLFHQIQKQKGKNKYSQMKQNINELSLIIQFVKQLNPKHKTIDQYNQLMSYIHRIIEQYFNKISKVLDKPFELSQKQICIIHQNIGYLEQISLINKVKQQTEKIIQQSKKSIIQNYQNQIEQKINIHFEHGSRQKILSGLKIFNLNLSKKFQQLKGVMKIPFVEEALQRKYLFLKNKFEKGYQQYCQRILEKVQYLYLVDIKSFQAEVVFFKLALSLIKKSFYNNFDNYKIQFIAAIRQSINSSIDEANKSIKWRLQKSYKDSSILVSQQYQRLYNYQSFLSTLPELQFSINKFDKCLFDKIVAPYNQFIKDYLPKFKRKNLVFTPEDRISFSIFCQYHLKLKQIAVLQQRRQLSKLEYYINQELAECFNMISQQMKQFYQSGQIARDLKKILLFLFNLNEHQSIVLFLKRYIDFSTDQMISKINMHLVAVRQSFVHKCSLVQQNIEQMQYLTELLKYLQIYIQVDDLLVRKQHYKYLNFRQLAQQIQKKYRQKQNFQITMIKFTIGDNLSSQIHWNQLINIQNRYKQNGKILKTISKQLLRVQLNVKNELGRSSRQIINYYFDVNLIGRLDVKLISDFMRKLEEAKHFYEEIDNLNMSWNRIIKVDDFLGYCNALARSFQVVCQSSLIKIREYNLFGIDDALNFMSKIQNMINLITSHIGQKLQNLQSESEINPRIKLLRTDILHLVQQMKFNLPQNVKNDYINTRIKLTSIISTIVSVINEKIQLNYFCRGQSATFILDRGFKKYYCSLQHFKQSQQKEKLRLSQNLYEFFNELKQLSCKNLEECKGDYKTIKNELSNALQNIPKQLKQIYKQLYSKMMEKIEDKKNTQLSKIIRKIYKSPQQLKEGFELLIKMCNYEGLQSSKRYVVKFIQMFEYRQSSCKNLIEKTEFIEQYLLVSLDYNIQTFNNNSTIRSKLQSMLMKYLEYARQQLLKLFKQIKDMSQQFQKRKQNIQKQQQIISKIFKIINFLMNNKQKNKQIYQLQKEIIEKFLMVLEQIVSKNEQLAKSKPIQNIFSEEIYDDKIYDKFIQYIKYLRASQHAIGFVKRQVQKLKDGYQPKQKLLEQCCFIKKYRIIFDYYSSQIKLAIQNYQLNSDLRKIMPYSQLQKDLIASNQTIKILQKRQTFFKEQLINQVDHRSYSIKNLLQIFQIRYHQLQNCASRQISLIFKGQINQYSSLVDYFFKIMKIIKQNNLKLIPRIKNQQYYAYYCKLIAEKYETIHDISSRQIRITKSQVQRINTAIKILKNDSDIDASKIVNKFKKKTAEATNNINTIYDEKIKRLTQRQKIHKLEAQRNNLIFSAQSQNSYKWRNSVDILMLKLKQQIKRLQQKSGNYVHSLISQLIQHEKALLFIQSAGLNPFRKFDSILSILSSQSAIGEKICNSLKNQNRYKCRYALALQKNHDIFQHLTPENNQRIGYDIRYMFQNIMKLSEKGFFSIQAQSLLQIKESFKDYLIFEQQHKKNYKNNPCKERMNGLILSCKNLGYLIKKQETPIKKQKVKLLAGICAVYQVINSKKSQGEINWMKKFTPHSIITAIILIGTTNNQNQFRSKLAQIGASTGNGKFAVFALLSCFLALVGFNVACSYQSNYLQEKYKKQYLQLYKKLGVEEKIKIGSLNQIYQGIFTKNNTSLQDEVLQIMSGKGQKQLLKQQFTRKLADVDKYVSSEPTALIIDQISNIFSGQIFQRSYCPTIKLKDITITDLLHLVWNVVREKQSKSEAIQVDLITKSYEFIQVLQKYPALKMVLQNQVSGMIAGALYYKHKYQIIGKKIVYHINGSIDASINYGYKTIFANIYEYQRQNVSYSNLTEVLCIQIAIGQFFYALLPQYYDTIIGFTSSYEAINHSEKEWLRENYRIAEGCQIHTSPQNYQKIINNYIITHEVQLYRTIVQRIVERQVRPSIIYFNSIQQLKSFYLSQQFQPLKQKASIITEQTTALNRDSIITFAGEENMITLATKQFTNADFVISNPDLLKKGGFNIIQAYFCMVESQQILKRDYELDQSRDGSCIISSLWLQYLGINAKEMLKYKDSDVIYNELSKARDYKNRMMIESTRKKLGEANSIHNQFIKLYSQKNYFKKQGFRSILKLNKFPLIQKNRINILLALQADYDIIQNVKDNIPQIFQNTWRTLQKTNLKALVNIKIVVYHNYDRSFEDITEQTAYQNGPNNLKRFLQQQIIKNTHSRSDIDILLQVLHKQKQCDRVILIGNSKLQPRKDTMQKRMRKGEQYWISHGLPQIDFNQQMSSLKQRKFIYLYNNTEGILQRTSFDSNGSSNFPSNTGFRCSTPISNNLTKFTVQQILRLVSQKSDYSSLKAIEAYKNLCDTA